MRDIRFKYQMAYMGWNHPMNQRRGIDDFRANFSNLPNRFCPVDAKIGPWLRDYLVDRYYEHKDCAKELSRPVDQRLI